MMPHLGPLELGMIVLLVMIIFGVGKLPQVGGALGKGIRAFRRAKEGKSEEEPDKSEEESVKSEEKS